MASKDSTSFGTFSANVGQMTSAAIFRTSAVPAGGPSSWADQTVSIQLRTHRREIDPFDYARRNNEAITTQQSRKQVFDRISAVAEMLFAAQQRVFLFMLFIVGRRVRLLRWDRAGLIVTPAIDYYEHPHTVCDMLWRIGHLDDSALGFDPSASRVLPGDANFTQMDFFGLRGDADLSDAERRLQESELGPHLVFEYVRSLFRASLASDWPRYKLQVGEGDRTREFLVGKPTFLAEDVIGRGTRGYVALDCETGRFVWLKDCWRAAYMTAETEGQVLRKLNAAGVQHVPTLVCEGDVRKQATITADWWERTRAHASALPQSQICSSPAPSSATSAWAASSGSKKRKQGAEPAGLTAMSQRCEARPGATVPLECPLRQHRHYRIVVEEVCMPLKDFRYGRQLVAIVADCVLGASERGLCPLSALTVMHTAHYQAATNPRTRILHCDISGGNILIYPRIKRDSDGNNPILVWTGLLTDWELSKPVDAHDQASPATQTDRMVGPHSIVLHFRLLMAAHA